VVVTLSILYAVVGLLFGGWAAFWFIWTDRK
jgi:hypothetical protein